MITFLAGNHMSTTRIMLATHIRSARSALRHDTQMRIVWAIVLITGLAGGFWSAHLLAGRLAEWQKAGPDVLRAQLWLLFARTWVGLGLLAILSTLRDGLNDREALLLLTLPIPPAARFRALLALTLIQGLGLWLLLLTAVTAATLRADALVWLPLGLLGMGVAALCGIVVTLLVVRHLIPRGTLAQYIAGLGGLGLALALCAVLAGWITVPPALLPTPGPATALFALSLIVAAGCIPPRSMRCKAKPASAGSSHRPGCSSLVRYWQTAGACWARWPSRSC